MKHFSILAIVLFALAGCKEPKNYTSSKMIVLDGKEAVGGNFKFRAIYNGVSAMNNGPMMQTRDESDGTLWWISFEDKHKEAIAGYQNGQTLEIDCTIERVEDIRNQCSLK